MAGAKYTLKLDAVLGDSKPLNVQLKKTISDLEKSGNTDIKVRIVTDEAGLKQFAVSSKDAFGGAERVVGQYDKKLDGAVKTQKTYSEALDKSTKKQNYFAQGMIQSIKSAAKYALSIGLIYKALQEIGKGVQYIKELDKEMRDIQIVAGYTDEQISELAVSYNELAKAMGATTLEVASGSLEWTRQGKTIEETQELLRATLMLSKLGNVEAAEATEYLTSILNGFKMEAEETETVVSKLVAVDNAAATSVKELATALQKSSVSAQAAGVDFQTLVAYIGTVSSVTRLSAETVGTSFKTMFARFQDIKEGAIDGEGAINNVERALGRVTLASGEQMSIMNRQTGEFKDFTVVVEQLAGEWHNLSEMEQANIVKAFAGVRQRESFLALMENQEMMHGLLAEAMDSEGLAADRYEIYLDGLAAAQNRATAAWEGMIQATSDGGLIKAFYNSTAAIFEFIDSIGGLDEAIPQLLGLASAMTIVAAAAGVMNPLVAAALAVGAITTAVVKFTDEVKTLRSQTSSQWTETMDEVAESTHGTTKIVEAFVKTVESLNDLNALERLSVDKDGLVRDQLTNTLALLKENSVSWDDYTKAVAEAANAAGYFVDENGDVVAGVALGNGEFKAYGDVLDVASEAMYGASDATDGWAAGVSDLREEAGKTAKVIEDFSAMTQNFQRILESAFADDDGAIDEKFKPLLENLSTTNELYQQGYIDMMGYFSQLEESLDSVDISTLFGEDDTEASEAFFSGLVENSLTAFDTINASFENGSISLTEYTEQLAAWGDTLLKIEEIASDLGFGEILQDALGGISGAVGELTGALELNAAVEDSLYQMSQGHMEWASKAYADRAKMLARLAEESRYIIKDMEGNVITGAANIEKHLMEREGNMANFSNQVAAQTGKSVNDLVRSAGDMLQGLAKSMGSFKASIKFVPDVSNNISFQGMFENWKNGGGITLPTFGYNIQASGSVSAPSGGSDYDGWMAGGAGGDAFESAGTPSISDMVGNFGEMLSGSDYGSDWGADMYNQTDIATRAFEGFGDSAGSIISQMQELAEESGRTAQQITEDAKSIDALLAMVVKKIKQEQKARKDSLKDQLSTYKQIIDARKDLLKTMQDEEDYQRRLEDNQRDLGNVQSEMAELRLDDSEEAQARLRALEEEALELQNQIDEDAFDRSIELQENALDEEYNNFEDYINAQIDAIDDYLAQPGQIVSDALSMIESQGESLYSELINWNEIYGSGITNDVVTAWDDAYEAMSHYANGLSEITGNNINGMMPMVGSQSSGVGENRSMPMLSDPSGGYQKTESTMGGGLSIENFMKLDVAGNLDSSTIPQIESIVDRAIEKLNESMRNRGFGQRSAGQYSI